MATTLEELKKAIDGLRSFDTGELPNFESRMTLSGSWKFKLTLIESLIMKLLGERM